MSIPNKLGGVYCLGRDSRSIAYVGRAERDLREKVKSHWQEYQFFWYEPSLSPRECFERHCHAFHKHEGNGLEHKEHPVAPEGQALSCPVCGK